MSSSISSSDPASRAWRRFFRLAAGTAAVVAGILYAFVILVDPFDTLPLSWPADRGPVAGNARFAFPALARASQFDSAVIGTSTSRLLRPQTLDPAFQAHFANLAMNDATAYEMARLLEVFARAHPAARQVMVGLDVRWCSTGRGYEKLTGRPFPEWMYGTSRWHGYAEMFNLYAIQIAGQAFGILTGLKPPNYGRDGYTSFVPPDSQYDPARVAQHLRAAGPSVPPGEREGEPASWLFPTVGLLRQTLATLSPHTGKLLFFVPYNHVLLSPDGSDGAAVWAECKRRIVALAGATPNAVVVDFMLPSPVTLGDDNYWDPLHYRVGTADRLALDLAAAARGQASEDYRILWPAAAGR